MRVALMLSALVLVFGGCATTGSKQLPTGRGLHWAYGEERLANEGYPGYVDEFSSTGWGVLYDEEGIPYGPKSFYEGRTRLEHPRLEVTDDYIQSGWVRIERSECCTEALLGHYLEILDLAWKDVTGYLHFVPEQRLKVYTPADMEEYFRVSEMPFFVTHRVEGPAILIQPVDVLFRRTLAGHVAYAVVTEAILDLKCHGRIPRWLRDGLASYLANEGFEHLSFMGEFRDKGPILRTPLEVEQTIYPLVERETGRIARYNAFLMVWHLSERHGFDRLVELLDQVEQGLDFEDAVRVVYGVSKDELLAAIDPTVLGEPTTTTPPRGGH